MILVCTEILFKFKKNNGGGQLILDGKAIMDNGIIKKERGIINYEF